MNNYKIINKSNLVGNIKFCKSKNKKIMAMVKANAYGHGVDYIAKISKNYINFFGVANEVEALKLRRILPYKTILIVGKSKEYKQLILNNIHIKLLHKHNVIFL